MDNAPTTPPHSFDGENPSLELVKAFMRDDIDRAIWLVRGGADTETLGKNGETLLHIAAKNGNVIMSTYAITLGVDITSTDFNGKTARDLAVSAGKLPIAAIIDCGENRADGLLNALTDYYTKHISGWGESLEAETHVQSLARRNSSEKLNEMYR